MICTAHHVIIFLGIGVCSNDIEKHEGTNVHVLEYIIFQRRRFWTAYAHARIICVRRLTLSVTEITQLAILFTPGSERRLKKSSYSANFKINWCNLITSAPPTLLYSRSRIVSTSIAGSNHLTNARKAH